MKWPPFKHDSKTYDLTHLHPCTLKFERPAEGNRAAEVYTVDVVFTLHCFSREPKEAENSDASLIYPDSHEKRLFDFRRYELSKLLPSIIQALPAKKAHHGNRSNFFSVEIITENGTTVEYDIFFKMKKVSKGRLEMLVQTAFVRDPAHESTRPDGKPIRFWIILYNTLNNKPFRT